MGFYAGFDLGGTKIKSGIINNQGKVVCQLSQPTANNIQDLLHQIKKLWENLKTFTPEQIKAVGLGFPGIYNFKKIIIHQSPHLPFLDNFPLSPALTELIEVPFFINNDANLAAFGEFLIGSGQGVQSMVFLTIGTGVGSGIIFKGKLWQGKCGYAGELGHIIVNPEGEICDCRGRGCLETEVCSSKIVQNYLEFTRVKEKLTAEEVFERAKKGDKTAQKAFQKAGYYLGLGLASIINLLNPEKIILGGGVMEAGDFLLKPALEEVKKRAYQKAIECCKIEKASLGNNAGIIGAGLWAKHKLGD
ncbi:MAG: ROK family protein [Candidatus Aminicenantia bacterium]